VSLLPEHAKLEQAAQVDAEEVEVEGEWIDAEFEALEDARLDKALRRFESRGYYAEARDARPNVQHKYHEKFNLENPSFFPYPLSLLPIHRHLLKR
jgi:hypothetical protein